MVWQRERCDNAQDYKQAVEAVNSIIVEKIFGESGNKIIIEEYLEVRRYPYFLLRMVKLLCL